VLRLLLKKSREGTRITYIPGNHDRDFRALIGARFGNVEIAGQCIHTTRTGRRLLVLHGDEFDSVIKCAPLAVLVGAAGYRGLLALNRLAHWFRDLLGRPYWSLAQHVKGRIGNAMRYVSEFQRASLLAAKEARVDGVVCGHIHRADLIVRDGLLYCNDGDWVESCTALAENPLGELKLITWRAHVPAVAALEQPVRDAA
jgi:UDP-2,3-diacylglucosamine pyrophosphatase LpxH